MRPRLLPVAFLALFALTAALAACGGGDGEIDDLRTQVASLQTALAQPQPDRVVGVVLRCTVQIGKAEITGEVCRSVAGAAVYQEVTVRTASGAAYTVKANASQSISVGQVWP